MVDLSGDWLTALNIAVSASLSAALVALYFKQTRILESQRDLRRPTSPALRTSEHCVVCGRETKWQM